MASGQLRRDLEAIEVAGDARPYQIIVDEISGRFARVADHIWQQLTSGRADDQTWQEAQHAGWTRNRIAARTQRQTLFSIRIPFGGIDWLSRRLATISGPLFSVPAIAFWCAVFCVALALAVSRAGELMMSLSSLATFLQQTNPLLIGAMFVFTKACHELGHAVMCRRMGARSGEVGVLLLCGMPCPYCDVTQIWRQPSAVKRSAVMLAGIYVELIIAALATFVWCFASDPSLRLMMLNLMVVCGISTIIFNANPLMRYDGYYVLADMLGSVNLRREAATAFQSVVTRRLAGGGYAAPITSDRRNLFLAFYHSLSKVYRVFVTCAIAALVIGLADWLHLRSPAIVLVVVVAMVYMVRSAKNVASVLSGKSKWQHVGGVRRFACVGLLGLVVLGILFAPLPRFRRAVGVVDSADAVSVFLPESGRIESVHVNFGDQVQQGETIVRLDSAAHQIKTNRLTGQLRLAQLRGNFSRREVLADTSMLSGDTAKQTAERIAVQWNTLQAAEDAVRMQLVSAKQRMDQSQVRAAVSGIVIPAKSVVAATSLGVVHDLTDQTGMSADSSQAWCRVSPGGRLHVALVIDARDRPQISEGSAVMISLTRSPETVIAARVNSVSEIKHDRRVVVHQAAYEVLCEIPEVDERQLVSMIGQQCCGVFRLPRRSFASDFVAWMGDWIRG